MMSTSRSRSARRRLGFSWGEAGIFFFEFADTGGFACIHAANRLDTRVSVMISLAMEFLGEDPANAETFLHHALDLERRTMLLARDGDIDHNQALEAIASASSRMDAKSRSRILPAILTRIGQLSPPGSFSNRIATVLAIDAKEAFSRA